MSTNVSRGVVVRALASSSKNVRASARKLRTGGNAGTRLNKAMGRIKTGLKASVKAGSARGKAYSRFARKLKRAKNA